MSKLHLLIASALLLGGCGPAASGDKLWLAPNGDELHLKLTPIEPNPY